MGCLPHEYDLEVSGLFFVVVWFCGEGYRYIWACLFPLLVPSQLTGKRWLEMCAASRSGEMPGSLSGWCTEKQGLSLRGYAIFGRSSLL